MEARDSGGWALRLGLMFAAEHAVLLCERIIDALVPDVPREVRERKARLHYRQVKAEVGDEEMQRLTAVPVIVPPDEKPWL